MSQGMFMLFAQPWVFTMTLYISSMSLRMLGERLSEPGLSVCNWEAPRAEGSGQPLHTLRAPFTRVHTSGPALIKWSHL